MNRAWLVQQLKTGSSGLISVIEGRVQSPSAQDFTPHEKPFLVVRSVASGSNLRGDEDNLVFFETFMIFAHDTPGDYTRIDTILRMIRRLLDKAKDSEAGVVRVEWLDDSEDLRDDEQGTILRYARYRVLYKEETDD